MRPRVLFQGSFADGSLRKRSVTELELDEHPALALPIVEELGSRLIEAGFDLILTGATQLDHVLGESAVAACERLKINPRDRIRTYPHGDTGEAQVGFGMVLQPADKRWQEVRTFVVAECDAVIALIGGKGTSDRLQKAVLAKKPVFPARPIAVEDCGQNRPLLPKPGCCARRERHRCRTTDSSEKFVPPHHALQKKTRYRTGSNGFCGRGAWCPLWVKSGHVKRTKTITAVGPRGATS